MKAELGQHSERSTDPMLERAHWIWSEGESVPKNFYLYCRRIVTLTGNPTNAIVHVTADSRYKLYVNGQFVGRGPARADQRWQYYDTYDLSPLLRTSENVITAIVHQLGAPTHFYTLGRGGFLLAGDVVLENGNRIGLDTNDMWRVLPSPAWNRDTTRICPAVMWQEWYDARRELDGWKDVGFDDSTWQKPVLLGKHPVLPWENLVPRDIPFVIEEKMLPAALLDRGTVEPAPPSMRVDLNEIFKSTDEGQAAYIFSYVYSPVDHRVLLSVEGQGAGLPFKRQVWVNGVPYAPEPSSRSMIAFPIQEGWNELLIKIGREDARWLLDVVLGPAEGESYRPVTWHSARRLDSPAGRVWVAGPYGGRFAGFGGFSRRESSFVVAYEIEKAVLGRGPQTSLEPIAQVVPFDSRPGKNVAVLMAIETRHSEDTSGLRDTEKLLRHGDGAAVISTTARNGGVYLTLDFGKTVSGYVHLRLDGNARHDHGNQKQDAVKVARSLVGKGMNRLGHNQGKCHPNARRKEREEQHVEQRWVRGRVLGQELEVIAQGYEAGYAAHLKLVE